MEDLGLTMPASRESERVPLLSKRMETEKKANIVMCMPYRRERMAVADEHSLRGDQDSRLPPGRQAP